jgi:hypothetical protein
MNSTLVLMTHHGGLSLNIIIWRIGGGAKFPFALGPKNSLTWPIGTQLGWNVY